MPKKFIGINQKAAAVLARKSAAEELKLAKEQKNLEDLQWQDNDKHIIKKLQRKEQKEQKRKQTLDKKAENRVLLAQESAQLKGRASQSSKITRTDIENLKLQKSPSIHATMSELPLEENTNRMLDQVAARNVSDAIALLSCESAHQDKNPEKRLKATYKAFEKSRLNDLKRENPSLRLSQLKQVVFKEWERSSQNPLNYTE